jgi:hypothetical protein
MDRQNVTQVFLFCFIFLFCVIIYLCLKINKLENKMVEGFSTSTTEQQINTAVKKIYLADVEAIRLLSNFAIQLSQGGTTVPGNVNFTGNIGLNNNLVLNNGVAGSKVTVNGSNGLFNVSSESSTSTDPNKLLFDVKTGTLTVNNLVVNGQSIFNNSLDINDSLNINNSKPINFKRLNSNNFVSLYYDLTGTSSGMVRCKLNKASTTTPTTFTSTEMIKFDDNGILYFGLGATDGDDTTPGGKLVYNTNGVSLRLAKDSVKTNNEMPTLGINTSGEAYITGALQLYNRNIGLAGYRIWYDDDSRPRTIPILCSMIAAELNDKDVLWLVNPGYKVIGYKDFYYKGMSFTIDNTTGTIPKIMESKLTIYDDRTSSYRVYFNDQEINITKLSNDSSVIKAT